MAVAAVSRFASLLDGLARDFLFDPEFATMARKDLASGHPPALPSRRDYLMSGSFPSTPVSTELTVAGRRTSLASD